MAGFFKRFWPKRLAERHQPAAPEVAAPSPVAWADRWWTADNLRLHARDYGGLTGDAKVPVVCLHGLTRNAADFEDVAPWIAGQGRRVLALDVRGRGASAWDPDPIRYHPGTYAQDVISLLQAAGVSRAVFVGTSMGGIITMVLASLRPDMIEAAVLNDVGVRIAPEGLKRITRYVGRTASVGGWAEAAGYAKTINGEAYPHFTDADWLTFAHRLFEPAPGGGLRLAYDPRIAEPIVANAATPAPDLTPWFLSLSAGRRVLLVHGAQSDVLDRTTVHEMRLLAPAMDYAEIPGVGHAPTLSESPARQAMARLLNEAG
jgi:pimeloyl-ACP methyl ester carboxylesterase